jgi:hypothetical protein
LCDEFGRKEEEEWWRKWDFGQGGSLSRAGFVEDCLGVILQNGVWNFEVLSYKRVFEGQFCHIKEFWSLNLCLFCPI